LLSQLEIGREAELLLEGIPGQIDLDVNWVKIHLAYIDIRFPYQWIKGYTKLVDAVIPDMHSAEQPGLLTLRRLK
jgi:hypothetical protein